MRITHVRSIWLGTVINFLKTVCIFSCDITFWHLLTNDSCETAWRPYNLVTSSTYAFILKITKTSNMPSAEWVNHNQQHGKTWPNNQQRWPQHTISIICNEIKKMITFLWKDNFCRMTLRHFLATRRSRLAFEAGTLSTVIYHRRIPLAN